MKLKNWINISIGLAFTIICIWLVFRKVQFGELTKVISGGNYYWLIPAVIAQLIAILTRSQRWVILLNRKSKLEASIWSQGIGYLFTNLFPLRLGEVARVLVMSERCRMPVVQVAGTAVVERLLDVGTMIFALLMVLPWMQVPNVIVHSGEIFGGLVILGILLIVLLAKFKEFSFVLIDKVCTRFRFLPKPMIVARWGELIEGLTPLLRGSVGWNVVAFSMLTWLATSIVYFCSIRVFQPAGLFLEAVFMMVSLSLAVAVPSSPGFIGVFQFVGQQALVIPFGVKYSPSKALAITLIAYLVYYILSTFIGIIGMWRLGQSFSGLRQLVTRRNISE